MSLPRNILSWLWTLAVELPLGVLSFVFRAGWKEFDGLYLGAHRVAHRISGTPPCAGDDVDFLPPVMSDEEAEEQRRSFAFGNVSMANPDVTREVVDQVADEEEPK